MFIDGSMQKKTTYITKNFKLIFKFFNYLNFINNIIKKLRIKVPIIFYF